MKRNAALVLVIILLISSFPTFASDIYATRGEVADMLLSAADYYNPDVKRSDIIKGYEDGQLHEERFVSRAEALVMLSRAFGDLPQPVGHNARVALTADDFQDIPLWAEKELSAVFESGIVAGTAKGKFSPNDNVTMKQMKLFTQRVYALYATNLKDDFYAAINKNSLEKIKILPGNISAGTIENMQMQTSVQIDNIINGLILSGNAEGTARQKTVDFYKCIIDVESRNKAGIKPIKKYLDSIDGVKNITELTLLHDVISKELCVSAFLDFSLTVDFNDNSKYVLYFETMSPLMNKELYFEEGDKKQAYVDYLKKVLTLGGEDEETAISNAEKYYEFEKDLAHNMLSQEDAQDINKAYNVTSYNKISVKFPDFDLKSVLENSGLSEADKVIVSDISLVERFSQLYTQSNLEVLKTTMKLAVLLSCGSTLNEDFLKADNELNRKIFGIEGSHDIEQVALAVVQEVMPEYLGRFYVEEYFDEESKRDVENMTNDIIEVFKDRINKLSWMSDETKKKAKLKLDTLNVKIGYPDIGKSYLDDVKIVPAKRGGTYFSNMLAIKKAAVKQYGEMQFSKVDRSLWIMHPYTVNAAYNASSNDITLPAAILQAPLYSKNASREENLGGIGYIIAHEITHAFDSNGAQFDENGVVSNWWTEEDYAAFELLCNDVVEFFDGIEAVPAVQNNGRLTLDENIADLGAIACITQLAAEYGNLDYAALYTAVAGAWMNTSSREYAALAAQIDNHSNGKLRVNRVLVNFEEFYKAFDIKETDGMYVTPEDRISVW